MELEIIIVEIHSKLDKILNHMEHSIMATLKDVQDKLDAVTADVAAETAIDESVVTLLTGLTASVADLKQQLADAIAAGGSPEALQAVVDGLGNLEASVDANKQKLADAVTANTPLV